MSKVIGVTVGTPMNPEKIGGGGAVPEWAQQPQKPKYTAEEVGALSSEIRSDRYAINIEPNITRYHLSASAASMIGCMNMALIPDGYKAEIIIDNPYGEPTLPFFSDVLKDTSDDGKALTGLNGFVARDGAVLTIYKVRDADKFNWYLSKHGLPISGVAQIGQTIVVKSVNDAMQPTEWECANLPTGGGGEWKHIRTVVIPEDITTDTSGVNFAYASADKPENGVLFGFDTDKNGEPFDVSELYIYCDAATPHTMGGLTINSIDAIPEYTTDGGRAIGGTTTIGVNNVKKRAFNYTLIQKNADIPYRQFGWQSAFAGSTLNNVASEVISHLYYPPNGGGTIPQIKSYMVNLKGYGFSTGSVFEFHGR